MSRQHTLLKMITIIIIITIIVENEHWGKCAIPLRDIVHIRSIRDTAPRPCVAAFSRLRLRSHYFFGIR